MVRNNYLTETQSTISLADNVGLPPHTPDAPFLCFVRQTLGSLCSACST